MLLAICTSAIHLHAMDEWDGLTIAKGFYSGIGTKAEPYRIFTASQFLYFVQQLKDGNTFSGKYIELCNDIAFSHDAVSTNGNFYGDFDGNDHKIQVNTNGNESYSWSLCSLYGSIHDVQFVNAYNLMRIYTGGILYNCKFEFANNYKGNSYHGSYTIYLEGGTIANCVSNSAYFRNSYKYGGAYGVVYGNQSSSQCLNCYFPVTSISYGGTYASNYYGVQENCGDKAGNDWVQSHTERAYKSWPLTFSPTYPEYQIKEQPKPYNPSVVYPHSDKALYQWCYQKRKPITFDDIAFSSQTQTKNIVVPDDGVVLSFDFEADGYVYTGYNDGDDHEAWISVNGEMIVYTYSDKIGAYSCQLSAGTCEISCERSDIKNIRITYPTETLANETSSVLSKQTIMKKPGAYFCQVSYGEGYDVMYSDYVDYEKLTTIDDVTYIVNEDTTVTMLWAADKAVDVTIPETVNYDDVGYPVTSVSSKAFVDCTSLESIKCKTADVPALLGGTAFEGLNTSNTTLFVPLSSIATYSAAAGWKDFTNIKALDSNITGICGDNLVWTLTKDGELKITGTGTMFDFKSKQSPWYEYMELIQKLTIEDGVTSIGNYAFYDCNGLTSINIPHGVTSIGKYAFAFCDNVVSVTVPESVTSIDADAFSYLYKLTSVNICSIEAWCKIDFTNYSSNPLYNTDNLYLNGELVTELTIPNTITEIKSYSFYSYGKLTSITIPESVKSIGVDAFYGCSKIESLTIPKSVTSIDASSFGGCTSLSSIVVCEGNTVYDSRNNCNAIITKGTNNLILGCLNTTIPETVESIGDYAFYGCNRLTTIAIPKGVKEIGKYAFSGCSKLSMLTIPDGLISFGTYAFNYCTNLTSINIPDGIASIENGTFYYCTSLTSITIPEGVTSIGGDAFYGCTKLTAITIPENVTKIGSWAFANCKKLTSITCFAVTPPTISSYTFYGVNKSIPLHILAPSVTAYQSASYWNEFTNICPIVNIELTDGVDFTQEENIECNKITYIRVLPNLRWNALYVPFEIPVSEIDGKYEVAYINNVLSYDRDDNGTIDDLRMEIIKIKSGTLKANYPYLIKAKTEADKQMEITLENTTLYEAKSTTINCSSVYTIHEITGTYNRMTSDELTGSLAISTEGAWQPVIAGSYLNPFRLYMSISNRDDSPVKVEPAALSRVRICVLGEDEMETEIENVEAEIGEHENVIFDLSGRRVKNPAKGGVYIVNGKRVIF